MGHYHIYWKQEFTFFFFFLAALGFRCCTRAFSSCGEWRLLLVVVRGLLIVVACCGVWALGTWASVVVAHGLSSCGLQALEHRLSSCGPRAQLFRGMWDLPRPGLDPESPALAGGFLTTAPSGKPQQFTFYGTTNQMSNTFLTNLFTDHTGLLKLNG